MVGVMISPKVVATGGYFEKQTIAYQQVGRFPPFLGPITFENQSVTPLSRFTDFPQKITKEALK